MNHYYEFEVHINRLKTLTVSNESYQKRLNKISNTLEEYLSSFQELQNLMKQKENILLEVMGKLGPQILNSLQTLKEENKATQDRIGPLMSTVGSIVFFLNFMVIVGTFLLSRFMKIELVAASLDLSQKIKSSMSTLNSTYKKIHDINLSIFKSNDQLKQVIESQQSAVHQTASSSTEATQTAIASKTTTQNSLNSAQQVNTLTIQGRDVFKELVTSIEEVSESNAKMSNITQTIEEIFDKLSMIDDIVRQTKLLSFNASVEAARAGEHGRGFSVVAEEVARLAGQSSESSHTIFQLLNESKVEISRLIQDNNEKVQRSKENVMKSSTLFDQIDKNADESIILSKEVLVSFDEQSNAMSQIDDAINNIQKSTDHVDNVVRSTSELMQSLRIEESKLQEIIGHLSDISSHDRDNVVEFSDSALYSKAS